MEKIIYAFLIFLIACGSKKDQSAKKIENPDYLVSLEGIGPIKNEMKQHELETILGTKIPLTNPYDSISGSWMDSAYIKYKDADMRLTFVRSYRDHHNFSMRLTTIETTSPFCKTKDGIGIGSSKQEIIDAFPENMLIMDHDFENVTDTIPSKSRYIITVRIYREGPQIIFRLKDNKVHSIEVGYFQDDEE